MYKACVLMFLIFSLVSNQDCVANNSYAGQDLRADGLYYMRARYYDPSTGSFLTKDPMGVLAGTNTYLYVSDNPVNSVDLLGLFTSWDYFSQSASLVGGGVTATIGGAAVGVGVPAIGAGGAGVPLTLGGAYLFTQGASTVSSSTINLISQLSG